MNKLSLSGAFWSLYTLGFTVALPTILYYTTGSANEPPQESATVALVYLGVGFVSWLTILGLYSHFFIKLVFTDKYRLEKAAREGTTIIAKIIRKMRVGNIRDMITLDLRLAFRNLAGTEVELPYQLNDGKPWENRFEVGNTIDMSVRFDGQQTTFVPKTMQIGRNKGIITFYLILFILLLLAAVIYPIYSYMQESQGTGWRFLRPSHPWISVPLINLGVALFIKALMGFIRKATGDTEEPLRMVMHGLKTTGIIHHYRQTGVYINEQPQVQFEIEYTDQLGMPHTIVYKKVVSLLNIHKLSNGPTEIMYLPDEPEKIVFYDDLTL